MNKLGNKFWNNITTKAKQANLTLKFKKIKKKWINFQNHNKNIQFIILFLFLINLFQNCKLDSIVEIYFIQLLFFILVNL